MYDSECLSSVFNKRSLNKARKRCSLIHSSRWPPNISHPAPVKRKSPFLDASFLIVSLCFVTIAASNGWRQAEKDERGGGGAHKRGKFPLVVSRVTTTTKFIKTELSAEEEGLSSRLLPLNIRVGKESARTSMHKYASWNATNWPLIADTDTCHPWFGEPRLEEELEVHFPLIFSPVSLWVPHFLPSDRRVERRPHVRRFPGNTCKTSPAATAWSPRPKKRGKKQSYLKMQIRVAHSTDSGGRLCSSHLLAKKVPKTNRNGVIKSLVNSIMLCKTSSVT